MDCLILLFNNKYTQTHIILKNLIYKSHKKVQKKFPAYERKEQRPKGRKKNFACSGIQKKNPHIQERGRYITIPISFY